MLKCRSGASCSTSLLTCIKTLVREIQCKRLSRKLIWNAVKSVSEVGMHKGICRVFIRRECSIGWLSACSLLALNWIEVTLKPFVGGGDVLLILFCRVWGLEVLRLLSLCDFVEYPEAIIWCRHSFLLCRTFGRHDGRRAEAKRCLRSDKRRATER